MQLFSADDTIFSKKKLSFFCPQKVEKPPLKSCSEKLKSTFFPCCPELPKRPKQKNSCSKMQLIDQLYIELGLIHKKQTIQQSPFRIKMANGLGILCQINPIPTRLCHMIYCCGDESYPCLLSWNRVNKFVKYIL